jgi:hypothetical protein
MTEVRGTIVRRTVLLSERIAHGKLYSLEYNERPLNVPETLPLVNKMLKSFRLI